jgi:hypothetical protein
MFMFGEDVQHTFLIRVSRKKARSRITGHFCMETMTMTMTTTTTTTTHNGSILATAQIMKAVSLSASEAENGTLFENKKASDQFAHNFGRNGTSTVCYTSPNGLYDGMRYCQRQNAFLLDAGPRPHIYWGLRKLNLADFFYSKHHLPAHHQQMHEIYVYRERRTWQHSSASVSASVCHTRTNAGFSDSDTQQSCSPSSQHFWHSSR